MNSEVESIDGDNGTPNNEFIASYVWHSGYLSASYYNTLTMELFVAHEIYDARPDFWHLKNLFRQINVCRSVLAVGPRIFLTAVMELLELADRNPDAYRQARLKTLSNSRFVVYTNNEKTLFVNRKRVLELQLPRMPANLSDRDRYSFIESVNYYNYF